MTWHAPLRSGYASTRASISGQQTNPRLWVESNFRFRCYRAGPGWQLQINALLRQALRLEEPDCS